MADPRTFVLIGDFQDNITPALGAINNSIASLKRTMSTMTSKRGGGFSDVTQSVGRLVSAQKHLATSIKEVGDAAKVSTGQLKEYKNMVGKVARAHFHIAKAAQQAGDKISSGYNNALTSLDRLDRREKLMASSRRQRMRSLSSEGANAYSPVRSSRSRRLSPLAPAERREIRGGGRGGGGGGRDDFPFERFTLAMGVAQGIGQPIESAIVSGFQIGVQLMMKPFEYFAGALGERVQDQISDLKAAGALYSISKRSKNPFLKDIDEAIEFQQQTNATFANLAKDLPGVTNDYVQVGKRLSDTAARIVTQDFGGALKFAQEIREKEGGKYYGTAESLTKMTGGAQQREVIETILGNLTKKATLGGMGNRSGAGGVAGAYGLPGIIERLISEDTVSVGKFQRYASVFSDPAIADALARNVDKINATAKNSVDRARMLDKVLDEIVTPEMIEKLRISVDGIYQGFRSMFLDPDTGLFGLGRQFVKIGKKMNSYGQYLDEFGKVVTNASKAADVDLSIFEILADIFAQFGQVLMPIVEILPLVFDPLRKLAKILLDARHYGAELNRTFNMYRNGLAQLAKEPGFAHVKDFKDVRASLLAIGNIVRAFGGISTKQFEDLSKQVTSKDFEKNIGPIVTNLMNQLMNSKVAENIGKMIGSIVGSVLVEVASVTGFLSKRLKSSNKLFDGLKKGFEDAGGGQAVGNIFKDIFTMMFDGLMFIATKLPIQAYIIGALALTLPIAIQTFAMKLGHMVSNAIFGAGGKGLLAKCMPKSLGCSIFPGGGGGRGGKNSVALGGVGASLKANSRVMGPSSVMMRPVGPRPPKGFEHTALPGTAPSLYGVTQPGRAPSLPKPISPLKRTPFGPLSKLKGKGMGLIAPALISLSTAAPGLAKAAKATATFAKSIPGVGVALAGADFAIRKASGESTATAAGGAVGAGVGGVVGGVAGSFIPVPGGTFIGAAIGAWLGDWIGTNIGPILTQMGTKIQEAWSQFTTWLSSGFDVGKTLGGLYANLRNTGDSINIWFNSLPGKINNWWQGAKVAVGKAVDGIAKTLSEPSTWWALVTGAVDGFKKALADAANWIKGLGAGFEAGYRENRVMPGQDAGGGRRAGYLTRNGVRGWMSSSGEWTALAKGGLGDAVASEMRMKPPGSDLVIANSSETVIPAAGGHGMLDFVQTLRAGFNAMVSTYKAGQQKQESVLSSIRTTLVSNQQQTNNRLQKLETKFSAPGIAGGLGGAQAGGVDAFTPIAQRMGLTMTSGYRPGDPGWHGANRARDFSNSTGPTPQMMQFAQYMASVYGKNLKELIYTPLGFSIKNGQRVAPYAQGSHYNHVHVAYALGAGNPAFFGSQSAAERWERSMVSGSVRVGSVTGNSAEGFGSGSNVVNNITINQQPGQDAEELASIVAMKIGEAVADARASSLFV
jgi:hypothetical protein